MAAFDPATLDRWRALAIVDRDGTTVGTISEFYLDRETGYPTWALVNTGLFGATQTFVPLVHATEISDGLQVPYEKGHIKDTPRVDLHDELSPEEEAELFAHYGVEYEPSTAPAEGVAEPGPAGAVGPAAAATPGSGSAEGPGPVRADAGSAGSPTVVDDEGPGPVRADTGTAGSAELLAADGPGPAGAPTLVATEPGERPESADGERATGVAPEGVPAEPGSVGAAETVDSGAAPAPGGATAIDPDGPGPEGDAAGRDGSSSDAVPAEPGTTEPGEQAPADPERSQTAGHDPDLARTAPVEPGLPGSTAASPYGSAPATVDKVTHRSEASTDEPLRVPGEAGWTPVAAGSFEDHEPLERPPHASDRWREAKLAAERDRIARAAAAQPEERSPLERARRRLERLVGGGQDHPDPDELSPADREAAERARRARLGLDEDDSRPR